MLAAVGIGADDFEDHRRARFARDGELHREVGERQLGLGSRERFLAKEFDRENGDARFFQRADALDLDSRRRAESAESRGRGAVGVKRVERIRDGGRGQPVDFNRGRGNAGMGERKGADRTDRDGDELERVLRRGAHALHFHRGLRRVGIGPCVRRRVIDLGQLDDGVAAAPVGRFADADSAERDERRLGLKGVVVGARDGADDVNVRRVSDRDRELVRSDPDECFECRLHRGGTGVVSDVCAVAAARELHPPRARIRRGIEQAERCLEAREPGERRGLEARERGGVRRAGERVEPELDRVPLEEGERRRGGILRGFDGGLLGGDEVEGQQAGGHLEWFIR